MEDYYTSTVDGAAGFARFNAEPDYDDRPTLRELQADEYNEDEEEYDEEY